MNDPLDEIFTALNDAYRDGRWVEPPDLGEVHIAQDEQGDNFVVSVDQMGIRTWPL